MNNITPEIIDEFEKEYPPHDGIRHDADYNAYFMLPISQMTACEHKSASYEAAKQNARLQVWLKQREKIEELESALSNVHRIVCEGAKEGFNCHAGDWAERLFHSNQQTSDALGKRNT